MIQLVNKSIQIITRREFLTFKNAEEGLILLSRCREDIKRTQTTGLGPAYEIDVCDLTKYTG